MIQDIKIRYNTEKDKSDPTLPAWRVLINGIEHLAESVDVQVPCWTTQDEISPGLIKWHISCRGVISWEQKVCRIQSGLVSGVIWLTGLPAAGKSSIASEVAKKMRALGYKVEELDGDAIREVFPSTGFSKEDRESHIKRVGYMASRLEAQGVLVIASLISPYKESRDFVRSKCKNFFEVYVDTPLEVCEQRDPKGMYKKARAGQIKSFTGIDAPYEIPSKPELNIETKGITPQQAAEFLIKNFLVSN